MLSAGIRIIQYRKKEKTPILRYQEAMILRRLTYDYHALLIIDDYVDLALAVHADIVWQARPDFICAVSEITESDNIQNTVYELMIGYSRVR